MFYTSIHDQSPDQLPFPWSKVLAGKQILVAYGLCADCVPLEVGPLDQLDEVPDERE